MDFIDLKEFRKIAKEIRKIDGSTHLSYKRDRKTQNKRYRWMFHFTIKKLETGYFVRASGKTPERAFRNFVKKFYEENLIEKYNKSVIGNSLKENRIPRHD